MTMNGAGQQGALDPHRPRAALRPELRARQHAISSGHYLATRPEHRSLLTTLPAIASRTRRLSPQEDG